MDVGFEFQSSSGIFYKAVSPVSLFQPTLPTLPPSPTTTMKREDEWYEIPLTTKFLLPSRQDQKGWMIEVYNDMVSKASFREANESFLEFMASKRIRFLELKWKKDGTSVASPSYLHIDSMGEMEWNVLSPETLSSSVRTLQEKTWVSFLGAQLDQAARHLSNRLFEPPSTLWTTGDSKRGKEDMRVRSIETFVPVTTSVEYTKDGNISEVRVQEVTDPTILSRTPHPPRRNRFVYLGKCISTKDVHGEQRPHQAQAISDLYVWMARPWEECTFHVQATIGIPLSQALLCFHWYFQKCLRFARSKSLVLRFYSTVARWANDQKGTSWPPLPRTKSDVSAILEYSAAWDHALRQIRSLRMIIVILSYWFHSFYVSQTSIKRAPIMMRHRLYDLVSSLSTPSDRKWFREQISKRSSFSSSLDRSWSRDMERLLDSVEKEKNNEQAPVLFVPIQERRMADMVSLFPIKRTEMTKEPIFLFEFRWLAPIFRGLLSKPHNTVYFTLQECSQAWKQWRDQCPS